MCRICVDYWFSNITPEEAKSAILDKPVDEHTREVLEMIEGAE